MTETRNQLIARFAVILADLHEVDPIAVRLCEAGRRMLGADGAAMTLMTTSSSMTVLAASDDLAGQLEDLQDVVGEGPSRDAYASGELQVARFFDGGDGRWSLMQEHGARLGFSGTIVAVPLQPDGEVIGALTAHGHGDLMVDEATARFLGMTVSTALLQDPQLGLPGHVFSDVWPSRAQVHQATGMIISQVRVRPEDALALLRGQAFANDTTLLDVAQQIIERRINFRDFTIEGD